MTKYFSALLMFFVAWPSFAADVNGYTAQFECRAGGPQCNVDVATYVSHACDQTITTADSAGTINTKINGGSQYICITNGDYTGKGTITITASGTSGARKVLRYTRSGDNDDDPWNQSSGNQAKILGIRLNGADYWIIHRISSIHGSSGNSVEFVQDSGATNNIINRSLISGGEAVIDINGGADGTVIQNSVIRDATVAANQDNDCLDITGGGADNIRIVNNEIYNCPSHSIYFGGNSVENGAVLENNDVYTDRAWYTDCNGHAWSGDDAPCAISEAALSMKSATDGTSITQIIHNRFWGTKFTDTSKCCISGSGGQIISISDNGAGQSVATYVLFQNNIVSEGPVGIQQPHSDVTNNHNSFVGNIVWKIYNYRLPGDGQTVELINGKQEEFYLNSFIDAERWGDFGGTDSDWRCNAWLDAGTRVSSADSGTQVDNNTFYGVTPYSTGSNNTSKALTTRANSTTYGVGTILRTSSSPKTSCTTSTDEGCFLYQVTTSGVSASSKPAYCTTLGCTTTDGSIKVEAVRGPYTFYRKLKTGPEQQVIPYVRAHSSAPESYTCPSTYSTRKGIGISDSQ